MYDTYLLTYLRRWLLTTTMRLHFDRAATCDDIRYDHSNNTVVILTARGSPCYCFAAVIRKLSPQWKRPLGRPCHTWLRAVDADLGQMNTGLASAWRKAAIREDWRCLVDTATLQWSICYERRKQALRPRQINESV